MRIKEEIIKVVTKGKAAGVLRLVFHDAGTYEMDENSGTPSLVTLCIDRNLARI